MKKITLTKQDIQRDLLVNLKKSRIVSIFLTAIVVITVLLYPIHLVNYINGTPFDYTGGYRSPNLTPSQAMIVIPCLIMFLIITVVYLYYINLYKIKKGKFEIRDEKLLLKEKDYVHYYRRTKKENLLYFRSGRIPVENDVYSYSKAGDRFYIVMLNSKKAPYYVYHMDRYEIEL